MRHSSQGVETVMHRYYSLLRHMMQHKSKNTKDKYTTKTYKNRELQNRQQENITGIYTKKTEISKLSTSN